jgi:exosortase
MRIPARGRNGWTLGHLLGAAALAAVAVVAASDAWADLMLIAFKDEEASHIFLVPFAAAWIAWVRRESLRACRPTGCWVGPVIVVMGTGLWFAGYQNDIQSFWHGGAVCMAVGAALSVLGSDVLMRLLPAFAVLVFLVPIPGTIRQTIAQPLQTATAAATQATAECVGMEVDRWGNALIINGNEVTVAEACNGMRMVFTLFLVSYTFAFVTPLRSYVRFLVLGVSPLTAIVCNVARLVPTVWAYGWFSTTAAEQFHTISGWAMIAAGFLLLMGIIRILRWAMLPVSPFTLATSE